MENIYAHECCYLCFFNGHNFEGVYLNDMFQKLDILSHYNVKNI